MDEKIKAVSMDKKYRTRDGREVRVLCVDGEGKYPVVGLIRVSQCAQQWTESGQFQLGCNEHALDLLEIAPYDDFKVDEPVMVRDSDGGCWQRRHFAKYENGKVYCWSDSSTSWTAHGITTVWSQCRRPIQEEL